MDSGGEDQGTPSVAEASAAPVAARPAVPQETPGPGSRIPDRIAALTGREPAGPAPLEMPLRQPGAPGITPEASDFAPLATDDGFPELLYLGTPAAAPAAPPPAAAPSRPPVASAPASGQAPAAPPAGPAPASTPATPLSAARPAAAPTPPGTPVRAPDPVTQAAAMLPSPPPGRAPVSATGVPPLASELPGGTAQMTATTANGKALPVTRK